MPAGTYTETHSGVIQIIIVTDVTSTTTTRPCPESCNCAKIPDDQSTQ